MRFITAGFKYCDIKKDYRYHKLCEAKCLETGKVKQRQLIIAYYSLYCTVALSATSSSP